MTTSVSVSVPIRAGEVPSRRLDLVEQRPAKTQRVTFVSEAGDVIRVPFAPSELTIESLTPSWSVIERPGKSELLVYERDQLPMVTFTIFVAAEDQVTNPLGSVEEWLTEFRKHLAGRQRWRFTYGDQVDKDWWRFTDASIKTQLRSPVNNTIVVATADIQLTRASELSIRTGPVTGGLPPTTPVTTTNAGSTTYGTYTVKSSADTLWNLAVRFLGNGARWPEIAALNGITDPRKMYVGMVLKIPGVTGAVAPTTGTKTVAKSQTTTTSGQTKTVTATTTYTTSDQAARAATATTTPMFDSQGHFAYMGGPYPPNTTNTKPTATNEYPAGWWLTPINNSNSAPIMRLT